MNEFFEVGSMDAPRKVASTFELPAERVQHRKQPSRGATAPTTSATESVVDRRGTREE